MSIRSKTFHFGVMVAMLFGLSTSLAGRTPESGNATQDTQAAVAKAIELLQESGFTHRKTGPSTWLIERQDKSPILVATGADFLVLGIIVAEKKEIRASNDLNHKLLKLNHGLDFAKAGFDDDDDLFVRIEHRIRNVDLQSFKLMVEDVILGAERAAELLKPFLIAP